MAAFGELGIMGGVQDVKQPAFFTDSILTPLDSCWRNLSFVFFYANYASDKYWFVQACT